MKNLLETRGLQGTNINYKLITSSETPASLFHVQRISKYTILRSST